MKKALLTLAVCLVAACAVGQTFTNIDKAQYYGKINIPKTHAAIDANFALIEGAPGAINGATVSAVETGGAINKTVLTLADTPVVIVGASGIGFGGVKVYDFPAGLIQVVGVTVDSLSVTPDAAAATTDEGDYAFGSVITDDTNLSDATDIDFCPSTAQVTITNLVSAYLAATDTVGLPTTATDLNLNMLIDDADIASTITNLVDATVTVHWVNLGVTD